MVWGAEFKNTDDAVQIGSEVTNFYLVAKGTETDVDGAVLISPGVTFDAIAFKAVGGGVLPGFFATAPLTQAVALLGEGESDVTVDWYCFRRCGAITPATSGMGLEIRSPVTGEVTFSSLYPKIMRSAGKIPITSDAPFSQALPSGADIAFIGYGTVFRGYDFYLGEGIGPFPGGQGPTVKTVGSNVSIASSWSNFGGTGTGEGGGLGNNLYNGGVIAIDVTGF